MRKYIFVWILVFSLCCGMIFGQEAAAYDAEISTEENQPQEDMIEKKQRVIDVTVNFGANTYINNLTAEIKKIAAPSPILFMPSIGINIPNNTLVSFAPSFSIYYSYYQLANGMAVPAEMENRTATTISLIFDLPVSFSFFFSKSKLQLSFGPAALLRFAYLARNINGNDFGESGTAAEDVSKIQSFFWSNLRFLYASVGISWSYNVYKNTKMGPFATVYIPIGSLTATEGINGMMAFVGLKVSF